MKFYTYVLMFLVFLGTTAANCSKLDKKGDDATNRDHTNVEAGLLKGRVVDAKGNPVVGVKVYAGHTAYYNTNVIAVTDQNGYYKMNVANPGGTWLVHAELQRQYNGQTYSFYVYADNADPVSSGAGGVRNLTWKLSGPVPGSNNSKIGAKVAYYDNSPEYIKGEEIEFTLVPDGPLVDGTTGQNIVGRATASFSMQGTAVGSGLDDVPFGRYRISARYIPENGGAPQKMAIRLRDTGAYSETAVISFDEYNIGKHIVEVETKYAL